MNFSNKFYLSMLLVGLSLISTAKANENCGASADEGQTSGICVDKNESIMSPQIGAQQRPRRLPRRQISPQAPLQPIGPVLHNGDDGCPTTSSPPVPTAICRLDWGFANEYCRDYGGLPTLRQLVQAAISEGATGISISDTPQPGYRPIWVVNSNQQSVIDFYLRVNEDYRAASGLFGRHWFWSSSFRYLPDGPYVFGSYNGSVLTVDRSDRGNGAVRCVEPR